MINRKVPTWVFVLVFSVAVFAFTMHTDLFLYSLGKNVGDSMDPTLKDGQFILLENRRLHKIERGDIVVVHAAIPEDWIYDDGDPTRIVHIDIVKRVIGLPGESVAIHEGKVYINGELLSEPYITHQDTVTYTATVYLGPNQYWIMGDNRSVSLDSRSFGPVNIDNIFAVVIRY